MRTADQVIFTTAYEGSSLNANQSSGAYGTKISPAKSQCTEKWTEARVKSLKKMWLDGYPASQIAKALGGVTRNAVIGKAHRLKLPGKANDGKGGRRQLRRHKTPERKSKNAVSTLTGMFTQTPESSEHKKKRKKYPLVHVAPETAIPFTDRLSGECPHIYGDSRTPGVLCCGEPIMEGKHWCEAHHHQNTVPERPRRRRKKVSCSPAG